MDKQIKVYTQIERRGKDGVVIVTTDRNGDFISDVYVDINQMSKLFTGDVSKAMMVIRS